MLNSTHGIAAPAFGCVVNHAEAGTSSCLRRSARFRRVSCALAATALVASVIGVSSEPAAAWAALGLLVVGAAAYASAAAADERRSFLHDEGAVIAAALAILGAVLFAVDPSARPAVVAAVAVTWSVALLVETGTVGGLRGARAAHAARHARLLVIGAHADVPKALEPRAVASVDPRGTSAAALRSAIAVALHEHGAAAVLVDPDGLDDEARQRVETALEAFDVRVLAPARMVQRDDDAPLTLVRDVLQSPLQHLSKRLLDLTVAASALILLSPLILALAILVVADSGRPIFFRQVRLGRNLRAFDMIKFRTMRHDECDHAADRLTVRGDPRVTRIGAVLRRLSLDELPQLFNVIAGDMSLVGPRPLPPRYHLNGMVFEEVLPDYSRRARVLPGITGLAQLEGLRGTPDTAESALHLISARVARDNAYIERWSVFLDVRIIVMTVLTGAFASGAY